MTTTTQNIPIRRGMITVLWGGARTGKTSTILKLAQVLGRQQATVFGDGKELDVKCKQLEINPFVLGGSCSYTASGVLVSAKDYNETVILFDDVEDKDFIQLAIDQAKIQNIAVVIVIQTHRAANGCGEGEINPEHLDVFAKAEVGGIYPVMCQNADVVLPKWLT